MYIIFRVNDMEKCKLERELRQSWLQDSIREEPSSPFLILECSFVLLGIVKIFE
jgi:hypothetical protein